MSKTLWIIGKNGVVARALKQACEKLGLDVLQTSSQDVDVTSLQAIKNYVAQHHLGYIINCSAYTAVDTAEQDKDKAHILNVEAVKNLTQVCREKNIKLIHYSTDYVFAGAASKPYQETDPTHPVNVYGQTKEQGERWILDNAPHALVIRTSWVFSSTGHSFVRAMVRLMLAKPQLQVCDDQVGKATYAQDLAQATLEIKDLEGLFHFANDGVISRYEYAQQILRILEKTYPQVVCKEIVACKTQLKPTVAQRPSYSALATEKIKPYLSHPIASYKKGLEEVIPLILQQELKGER
jgi:dTDP-4-dehydrorhamnose reductase